MIQLNDFFRTAINQQQILYLNIINDPVIVGKIKCMFNNNSQLTLKYDCREALHADYQKLLQANNA